RPGVRRRRGDDRGRRPTRHRPAHPRAGRGRGRSARRASGRGGASRGRAGGRPVVRRRPVQNRGTDGRHLLPRAVAGGRAVRRGGRRRRRRPDALHPRGDEADERGEGRPGGDRPADLPGQRAAGRVRRAAVRARAGQRPPAAALSAALMFKRVLVANRGEIAVRVIRTLRELGVESVAVYSTADRDAAHVRMADRAVCIGPPPPSESYLSIASVVAAGVTTGCEAVHPGYGFLSERPEFVEACADNDLVFVGPDARVMAQMGDKVEAKAAMRAAGVPLVPGTEEATTLAQAKQLAPAIGFPVLLKAAAGGGGRGMRLVASADELDSAFATASGEADAAFGDGSLYLEKALVPARHVEIQVLADGKGGVLTLGERECSIQRRHQKLVEESPSAALTPESREAMEAAAERACLATGYANAGTLEFQLGPYGQFYFIEMNARLQVEHP